MSTAREHCETGCGFEWDTVVATEISQRVEATSSIMASLIATSELSHRRPQPDTWSAVEYAGHVRDVLFNLRDRLIVAMNEDNPTCKGLYGTSRIELGLYAGDSYDVVGPELKLASSLFARTWNRIPEEFHSRTMVYAYPRLADRTLLWVAAQALHEVEHHCIDIQRGIAAA